MAFRLGKGEIKQQGQLVSNLHESYAKVSDAIATFNEELEKLFHPVEDAINAYNQLVADAGGFASDIASRMRDEFNDKSDNWQSGDTGSAVSEFIDQWEGFEATEVDMPEMPSIEDPGSDVADNLDQLPTEV